MKNIKSSSYDSVTGVTTLIVNVAGTTKTYLVAEKDKDLRDKNTSKSN